MKERDDYEHQQMMESPTTYEYRWFLGYLFLVIIGLLVLIVGWITGHAGY